MSTEAKSIKIWYQSFVDQTQQVSYFRDLGRALHRTADPGVRFDLHGIVPPDVELHRLTEFRCAREVVRNALAAQQQGYDAVAIGHFQDAGLYEARAAVEIPVIGLGESSMLYACMLGRKIALVTINPIFIPMHEEQINRYGLRDRVVAVKAITTDPTMLVHAFTDSAMYDRVIQQFREQAQPLVDIGVEVIIPAGGLPALLFSRMQNFTVGQAVVLNCIDVLATMTETAVKLRRLNGMQVSRASTFTLPSAKALREFLDH
jgi:Asp/Glu/hydantoin racemase